MKKVVIMGFISICSAIMFLQLLLQLVHTHKL